MNGEQVTNISDLPYIALGRDLVEELDGESYVEFRGEWSPEEPEGWEVFRVMLHGVEAGDQEPATWEDLQRIVAARQGVDSDL